MGIMGNIASPKGQLVTGVARNALSNMRRKKALQANQGIHEQQGDFLRDWYSRAGPAMDQMNTQSANATGDLGAQVMGMYAGQPGYQQPGTAKFDPAAWDAANPAPTAPTMRDASGIKFNPLMPRGARDAIRGKIDKKNQGKQEAYDAELAGYNEARAAAEAAGGTGEPGPETPNLGENVLNEYKTRQDTIDSENAALAASMKKGYEDRYGRGMAELEGRGEQAKKDIDQEFKASGGKIVADAQNRGLYNTTVLSNMEAGNENSRIGEQKRLEDTIRGERIGLDKELSEDTLRSESDLGKFKSSQKVQLTGDTLQNMDSQRREAIQAMLQTGEMKNEADRRILADKLGLSEQFLRDTLDWFDAQKQPVGEYSPLLDAVPGASASYTQREAQRQAESAARDSMWAGIGTTALTSGVNLAIPAIYGGYGNSGYKPSYSNPYDYSLDNRPGDRGYDRY